MKSIYVECKMGCTGTNLLAALVDLLDKPDEFILRLNHIGLTDVQVKLEGKNSCHATGKQITKIIRGIKEQPKLQRRPVFTTNHTHLLGKGVRMKTSQEEELLSGENKILNLRNTKTMNDFRIGIEAIFRMVDKLLVSQTVKRDIKGVFELYAKATSKTSQCHVSNLLFKEMDVLNHLADIAGVCVALEELGHPKVTASPIHVGNGSIMLSDEIIPVPTPVTAYLLEEIPYYTGEVYEELCSPMGAALLKYFVSYFGNMPIFQNKKTGYGFSKMEQEKAHYLRVFYSEYKEEKNSLGYKLVSFLEHMTAEDVKEAQERIIAEGASEAYVQVAYGNDFCGGYLLSCYCEEKDMERCIQAIYRNTTAIKVTQETVNSHALKQEQLEKPTPYGQVKVVVYHDQDTKKVVVKDEEIKRLTKEFGKPFLFIKQDIMKHITNEDE